MSPLDYIGLESGRWINANAPAYKPTFGRIALKLKELGITKIEELPADVRHDFEAELEQIADIINDEGPPEEDE